MSREIVNTLDAPGSAMYGSFPLQPGDDPIDPPARQGARHPLEVEGLRISIALVAEA